MLLWDQSTIIITTVIITTTDVIIIIVLFVINTLSSQTDNIVKPLMMKCFHTSSNPGGQTQQSIKKATVHAHTAATVLDAQTSTVLNKPNHPYPRCDPTQRRFLLPLQRLRDEVDVILAARRHDNDEST